MCRVQYEGELMYVSVTETHPAAYFWGINVTFSTYGTTVLIPDSTAGIVDTGTTCMCLSPLLHRQSLGLTQMSCFSVVLLANDFFSVYLNAIPGATVDNTTGLIEIPPSSVSSMQPISFFAADHVFFMDVAAQLIPTDQNTAWGGVAGKQYGVVNKLGANSGQGLDFVLGMTYMERYYAVSRDSTLETHKRIDSLLAGIRHGREPRWICSDVSLGFVSNCV